MTSNWNGTIFNTSKQLVAFADDAELILRGTIAIKEIGLNVNEDKTNYFTLDRKYGLHSGNPLTF